jgi:hypothetical protein
MSVCPGKKSGERAGFEMCGPKKRKIYEIGCGASSSRALRGACDAEDTTAQMEAEMTR